MDSLEKVLRELKLPAKERTEPQAPLHLEPPAASLLDLSEGVEERPRGARRELLVPGSSHAYLGDAGWPVFLAAFEKAAEQD